MKALLPIVVFIAAVGTVRAAEQFVYFGTGGGPKSKGIYMARLDLDSGKLSQPTLAAEVTRPGFLALHPNHKFLYCVCLLPSQETKGIGGVTAFAIDGSSGELRKLNQQSSGGAGPCHLAVDQSGRCVLVANYGSGNVAALPIAADGSLKPAVSVIQHEGSSVNPQRQQGPHAHSINVGPDNCFAFAADLGIDKVLIYKLASGQAKLTEHDSASVAAGAGPRHLAFHPNAKFAYVINELLSTITAFAYDGEQGTLSELQTTSTLPEKFTGNNSTAEVQVHPSGKFVYGSNRGHDTIAVFACDPNKGTLTFVEHEPIRGQIPRNFGIDPTGTYLLAAGQKSDTVAVFRIDQQTGSLEFAGSEIEVPTPICVKFLQMTPSD